MKKILSIDWAHEQDKIVIYDGKKVLSKLPEDLGKGDIVVTENMPHKMVLPLIKQNVNVLRCSTNKSAELREKLGLEKTDVNDAKIIYMLYQQQSECFREYKGDMKLVSLYSAYKNIQHNKVAFKNCSWALEDEDLDVIEEKMLEMEKIFLKRAEKEANKYDIYTKFLKDIKGLGPSLSAGLIAYTGDIERFANVSKLWKYFGYDVRNGEAPKKKRGEPSSWHHKARSLMFLVSDQFIKQRTPVYREIYDIEKERQLKRHQEGGCEKCNKQKTANKPGHPDAMARRKAIKIFLQHYWVSYRKLKGLPTNRPWILEHGGHTNYIAPIQH